MRGFIHHPTEFPILVSSEDNTKGDQTRLCSIGQEGVACRLHRELPPGAPVTLRIPLLQHEYRFSGRVTRCDRCANGFGVSILFKDETESFKSKMVEQVCQIEHYRRELLRDGRDLDSETAAQEWIERYSNQFSKTFTDRD